MKIFLEELPLAKRRPRFSCRGKVPIAYDAQRTQKLVTRKLIIEALDELTLSDDHMRHVEAAKAYYATALSVRMRFHYKIPPSTPAQEKNLASWGYVNHISKPDIDNVVKYYLDCGNGILWSDDRIIDELIAEKVWSRKQGVEIEIRPRNRAPYPKVCEEFMQKINRKQVEEFMEESAKMLSSFCDFQGDDSELSLEAFTARLASFCHYAHPFVTKVKKSTPKDIASIYTREVNARNSL